MNKNVNRLISGALILTVAGFISKIFSAIYRIPLQNLTGDLGFYLYQQIYPFIATIIILSLYGFPMAVSKITAERLQEETKLTYQNHFIPIFFILFIINSIFAVCIYFLAPFLTTLMQDVQLTNALQMIAVLFLFIPFISLFRGVFQAQLQMKPTAYTQIVEQAVRVTIIVIASLLIFFQLLDVHYIAEAAVISSAISMFLVTMMLTSYFLKRYPLQIGKFKKSNPNIPWRKLLSTIFIFGLIATANHITLIVIQFVDVLTLVPNLIAAGYSPIEAMEWKGIFDRGIPLIQFGVIFGSSFALAFIPSIKEEMTTEQGVVIKQSVSLTFYLSVGATVGLICLLREVNTLFFLNDLGTEALQILAISILLLSLTIINSAILQGHGYVKRTIVFLLIAFILKFLFNYLFIAHFGIVGSALATICSLAFLMIISSYEIYRTLQINYLTFIQWKSLLTATISMIIFIYLVKLSVSFITFSRLTLLLFVLFSVLTGAFIFIVILFRRNTLTDEQIAALPFSRVFLYLKQKVAKIN